MVEQQSREGEVVSSSPTRHEFSAKNAATSMETGGRWPVAASPEKKFGGFLLLFSGFFSHFYFAECKSSPSVALGEENKKKKTASAVGQRRQIFPECQHGTRQSLPRVYDF